MTRYLRTFIYIPFSSQKDQLKNVFPTKKTIEPPSALIEDPNARRVWDARIGADKYFISFQVRNIELYIM